MRRTLITLLAGLGIIAAGAVQTSVRHHTRTAQVKTFTETTDRRTPSLAAGRRGLGQGIRRL
jgi:hypothetical protein